MSSTKHHIIVGGGIAGMVSAYCLANKGYNVVLAEAAPKLGGLLTSKLINGNYYDHGTHFLRETGIEQLDQFLFEGLEADMLPYVKSGTYYQKLFEENGFLSDFSLPEKQRKQYLKQLIDVSSTALPEKFDNLEQQLIALFGKGYYDNLLKSIVKKLFFEDAVNLAPDAHYLFGLARLIVASKEQTKELKQNVRLDNVLAFHSFIEGISKLKSLYPKSGGAGAWIDLLEKKLADKGVVIVKNAKIDFVTDNLYIKDTIINENHYETDRLYWTVPPVFLYDKLGLSKPVASQPKRLTSIVVDLEYTGEYNTHLYYLQNYDPDLKSFRITLYDNYNKTVSQVKRITVEFLDNSEQADSEQYKNIAKKELLLMNIVDDKNALNAVNVSIIKGGFPIPTPQFRKDSELLIAGLSQVKNLTLFGKASGKAWFMNEVIAEVYTTLS